METERIRQRLGQSTDQTEQITELAKAAWLAYTWVSEYGYNARDGSDGYIRGLEETIGQYICLCVAHYIKDLSLYR